MIWSMNATVAILESILVHTSTNALVHYWFYETVTHVFSKHWCAIVTVSYSYGFILMFLWLLKNITVIKVLSFKRNIYIFFTNFYLLLLN